MKTTRLLSKKSLKTDLATIRIGLRRVHLSFSSVPSLDFRSSMASFTIDGTHPLLRVNVNIKTKEKHIKSWKSLVFKFNQSYLYIFLPTFNRTKVIVDNFLVNQTISRFVWRRRRGRWWRLREILFNCLSREKFVEVLMMKEEDEAEKRWRH